MKTVFYGMNTAIYHDTDAKEEIKINVIVNKNQKQNQNIFSKIIIPRNK
jgi:hypothetical protein